MAEADPSDAATPPNPAGRRQLTVRRIAQFSVDFAVMTLLCLIPLGLMWLLVPRNPDGTMKLFAGFLAFCLLVVACAAIAFGYWVWLPGRDRSDRFGGDGRTPAMRWFRLRVVDQTGIAAGRSQLTLRWLLLLVDGIGFGFVGVAAMLTSPRVQRIGDLMAGTVVVMEHRVPGPAQASRAGPMESAN